VWERYLVVDHWSAWAPPIRLVESSASRIAAGVSGVVHGPPGVRVRFVVESVDESARRWSWRVRWGLVALRMTHQVLAAPGGGSRTALDAEGPAVVVAAYPEIARIALHRLVH